MFVRSTETGELLPLIAEDVATPGELTQSLCSPWQNDYRECGCYYWAASRPDYVNVEPTARGTSIGNNWMARDPGTQVLRVRRRRPILGSSAMRTCSATGRACCDSSSRAATMTELFELSRPRHSRRPPGRQWGRAAPVRAQRQSALRHRRADLGQLVRLRRRGAVDELVTVFADSGSMAPPYVDDPPPIDPPVRALSLAVAQKCNLGCTYCYAEGGSFGAHRREHALETALASVDLLLVRRRRRRAGQPRLPRRRAAAQPRRAARRHRSAARAGRQRGAHVSFSITTNGTQLTEDDGDFFEEHGFAVTVSLDGLGAVHDRLRPYSAAKAAIDSIMAGACRCWSGSAACRSPRASRSRRSISDSSRRSRFRRARFPRGRLLAAAPLADRPRRAGRS